MKFGPKETKQLNEYLRTGRNRNRQFLTTQLVDDLEPGSLKDELTKDYDSSQETYEEYLRRKNLERPFNMADGGRIGLLEGVTPKVQAMLDLITPVRQKYIDLKQAQIDLPEGGTLKNFPNYEQFLIQEIDSIKNTKDAKKLISSTRYYLDQPEKLSVSRKKLLDKLIEIENNKPGKSRAGHELARQAGYVYKTRAAGKGVSESTTTAPPGSFKNLISIEEKKLNRVDEVLRQLDAGLISLDDIIEEGSLTRYINKPFGFKSPESFDKIIRKNKKYKDRLEDFKLLNNQSFLNKYKGRGLLANEAQTIFEQGRTGGVNFSQSTQRGPVKKIFDFANRHIERGGKLIRRIDDKTFIYNNKIYSETPNDVDQKALKKLGLQNKKIIDLVLEGPKLPEFKEIFDAVDKQREYETIVRAHPITGKDTPLTQLLQEADYIAGGKDRLSAKGIFGRSPFEIDHFGSVKDDPFKNIRVIPRTINQAAGQFQRGVSTIKDIKQAEDFIGYSFTGDPLKSINQYIDTEIQRGQDPNYQGRSRKIAAAKTKAIDKAATELGQTGTRGGTILTQEIPQDVLSESVNISRDKRLKEAFTGVPVLEKTPTGKLTIGSRPVTEKEIISVPERDAMAQRLKDRLLKLDLGFLPKKLSTPLEVGQKIIRGFAKKDGGRIPFRYGKLAKLSAKRGLYGAFTPTGLATLFTPDLDLTKAENRITLAAEAAFAPELVKFSIGATKGMKDRKKQKLIQQLLNLGVLKTPTALRLARAASPIGIASLAAEGLYQGGKFTKKRIEELRSMTPEQRAELRRQGEAQAFDPFSAAGGGLAKQAGDRSGAMLESMNPDKDGLPGLLKRVKKL
jgi:hypothetical protein